MRHLRRAAVALAVAPLLAPAAARSQVVIDGRQSIDFDHPSAWAMKYFASVSMPAEFGAPPPAGAGDVDLGLEYVQVPSLDREERRVGFGGVKVEDLNKTPYVLRPTARVGLGAQLTLGASWVPPIERNGAEASILALSLGRPLVDGESFRLGLRLHGQAGSVEGDFTCSADTAAAGDDPERNPFGCEAPSRDEYDLQTIGLELSAAWRLGAAGRWEPFLTLSGNHMDLEFQVHARYSGVEDRSRLVTDGQTVYGAAGVVYGVAERWRLGVQLFYSPLDVVRPPSTSTQTDELLNLRAVLRYAL